MESLMKIAEYIHIAEYINPVTTTATALIIAIMAIGIKFREGRIKRENQYEIEKLRQKFEQELEQQKREFDMELARRETERQLQSMKFDDTVSNQRSDRSQEEPAYQTDFDRFLAFVVKQHHYINIAGLKTKSPIAVELEKVYILPQVLPQMRGENAPKLMRQALLDEEGKPDEVMSLTEALKNFDKIVMLGGPGSGKTTALKYLALCFARSLLGEDTEDKLKLGEKRLPLFFYLRRVSENNATLPDLMSQEYKHLGLAENFFEAHLQNGRCIVLMDGLDEVTDEEQRQRVRDWVEQARNAYPQNRFVVTSRPSGYEGAQLGQSWDELNIQDFTNEDVKTFAHNWYLATEIGLHEDSEYYRAEAKKRADDLADRIERSEGIKKLAVNPLMLTAISLVHRYRATLPERRVELYQECTDVLLQHWDEAKGLRRPISAAEARQFLQPLAFWLHEETERSEAPRIEVEKQIAAQLSKIGMKPSDAPIILNDIRERSGVLVERSPGIFGFQHLAFQEYLAACHISEQNRMDVLVECFGESWWQEVTLLFVALRDATPFMRKLFELEKNKLRENLPLMLDCIEEAIALDDQFFMEILQNREQDWTKRYIALLCLERHRNEPASMELAKLLHAEEPPEIELVEVPAGEFLMGPEKNPELLDTFYIGKYPVTNSQYKLFVDATGYPSPQTDGPVWSVYWKDSAYLSDKPEHPIDCVDWYDANAFAQWAGMRLPTEEEWEKAARGTDGREYPWGDEFDKKRCNTSESGIGDTTPVGKYQEGVSPYGCYDMAGNVWEWTSLRFHVYNQIYSESRGGGYDSDADTARCWSRYARLVLWSYSIAGSRVAKSAK